MFDIETKTRVQAIWDKLADSGASNSDEAVVELLTGLAELLGAQHGYWMGTTRLTGLAKQDPVSGWRPRAIRYLEHTDERDAIRKEHTRRLDQGKVDPTIIENLRHAGEFRVNTKHELASPEWYETEFYTTFFQSREIVDVIYAVMPIGADVESWIALERIGKDKSRFGEHEQQLLSYAMRPTKWFHHQIMLQHGVWLADEPLNQSEQRVLKGLLTQQTEQEIAKILSLSPSTVHTYAMRICRKFGVRGRAGLTALWLGQIPED